MGGRELILLRDIVVLWFVLAVMVGASSAGLTLALRALPPIARQLQALKKPWVCDVCMSFWATGLWTLLLMWWRQDPTLLVVAPPAFPWAMWVLRNLTEPLGAPPPPMLEEGDDA